MTMRMKSGRLTGPYNGASDAPGNRRSFAGRYAGLGFSEATVAIHRANLLGQLHDSRHFWRR